MSEIIKMNIKFNEQGLVPAIVTDARTNEVLMQAYMNNEAIELTLKSGKAHYFSRSRNKIWLKGETSGHFQEVIEISSDCDNDSILLKVIQTGVACHTGARSCFFNNIKTFKQVPNITAIYKDISTIKERKTNPIEGSYTNYLFDKGVEKICKKIGEESSETIIAAMKDDKSELAMELADLYYHTLVLIEDRGISFDDVLKVMEERQNKERPRNY